ncbi:MAG: response regulator [Candidatus Abyssobacteria bacterium SURF_17]|jgi:DNA-binding NtrC family response regulator|uniref:Response regulator n=1 Tax=Candidatus Abyssobacteria bacterium SURF_17 TaxID=2093361 RepID=A0A419ETB2_9BACT|nr:MAG: response regulator [Candidatus Abyssubacteria bacterium SURF_17]
MPADKILLVDDEEEFILILSERMKSRGMSVETAESGPAAIKKAEKQDFDAVILDMMMPGMDGIETLKRLREVNPNLQVIMLTGHATLPNAVEAVKLGAADFLEKPANIATLIEKIKEAKIKKMVLEEKQAEERIRNILKSKGW